MLNENRFLGTFRGHNTRTKVTDNGSFIALTRIVLRLTLYQNSFDQSKPKCSLRIQALF